MATQTIITELLKRPIAYQPVVAKAVGSVKLGILWSQLYYWHDKGNDPEGWIYKTRVEIQDETALSRREQETARREGRDLQILEEKLSGNPAKLHYRIDIERMMEIINDYLTDNKTGQTTLDPKKEKATSSIAYLEDIPEVDIKYLSEKYSVSGKFVEDRADDVITYCKSKGKVYRDYKAALRNFIKTHLEKHPDQKIVKKVFQPRKVEEDVKERTPEEQARINKELAKVRKQLGEKIKM